jgi:hypothetical protein
VTVVRHGTVGTTARNEDAPMARKGKTGVLKRLREVKKAEKAALKREQMAMRKEMGPEEEDEPSDRIATADDMAGYGFPVGDEDEEDAR